MNTGTKTLEKLKRLNIRRLLFATAAFLVFNVLVANAYWETRQIAALSAIARLRFPDESDTRKVQPLGAAERTLAKNMAVAEPYRQDLLYMLYRDADARKDAKTADFYAAQMAKLGWRNTAVQRSLLVRAVNGRRFAELLDRADAMLRRDVLSDQVIQILFVFELKPDVRAPLVKALRRMPPWRGEFFAQTAILQQPAYRMARLNTVNYLLGTGATLSRAEIAPLVGALDRSGEVRQAEALWVRFVKPERKSPIYDPSFHQLGKLDAARPDLVMPFEWQLGQGTGYNSYLESTGGVRVEWDGRGVPVFLKQRLRLGGRRQVKVVVGLGAEAMAAASALNVALVCTAGGDTVQLDQTDISANQDALIFTGKAAGCDLPELIFSGALRDTASSVDFTIRSIQASAL